LGVVYSFPIEESPTNVFMEWELFDDQITRVPALVTDQPGGNPIFLDPANPILEWYRGVSSAPRPALVALTATVGSERITLPWLSILWVVCLLLPGLWMLRRRKVSARLVGLLAVGGLCVAWLLWPAGRWSLLNLGGRSIPASSRLAQDLPLLLLQNVYRSFDYRAEEQIYAVLEKSVAGDLLTRIYLETLRFLRLENQGGVRAKVSQVQLVSSALLPQRVPDGFVVQCRWRVDGSVGHWGHVHQRRNQYDANLTVQAVDGKWKITGLELLDQRRL
jgi:hypothetical protein